MPGSTARNGDWPGLKKSPGSPGLFLRLVTSRFQCTRAGTVRIVRFCTFGCRTCLLRRPNVAGKARFVLGFALIALAALVFVIFLP
jgi:hypothetical protein